MTALMLAESGVLERERPSVSVPGEARLFEFARSIAEALQLEPSDTLLDLGCGNGAVSRLLHGSVGSLLGVDRSAASVAAARSCWEQPSLRFSVGSPPGFTATAPTPWRFTVAAWYGSASQTSDTEVFATFKALAWRFRRIRTVLLTGRPHPSGAHSPWLRTEGELDRLAAAGWHMVPTDTGGGEWDHVLLTRASNGERSGS